MRHIIQLLLGDETTIPAASFTALTSQFHTLFPPNSSGTLTL